MWTCGITLKRKRWVLASTDDLQKKKERICNHTIPHLSSLSRLECPFLEQLTRWMHPLVFIGARCQVTSPVFGNVPPIRFTQTSLPICHSWLRKGDVAHSDFILCIISRFWLPPFIISNSHIDISNPTKLEFRHYARSISANQRNVRVPMFFSFHWPYSDWWRCAII